MLQLAPAVAKNDECYNCKNVQFCDRVIVALYISESKGWDNVISNMSHSNISDTLSP